MPLNEQQTFRLYRILTFIALGLCIYLAVFVSPLKGIILPPLKKFVVANINALVNVVWLTFILGSTSLAGVFWWIYDSDKIDRSRAKEYISQLVAKDYYKGVKKVDYYKAVKTALSKYSRQTPGEEDPAAGGSDVKTSDADKVRAELKRIKAKAMPEEPPEDTSDGTHRYHYPNGTLKKEVTYKSGKLDGVFRTYYEDGSLHQERQYQGGLLNGVFRAFDEFGAPYFEIAYRNGVKHGIENGYHKSGVVEYEEIYENGKRVSRKTFDEGGDLKFKHTSQS